MHSDSQVAARCRDILAEIWQLADLSDGQAAVTAEKLQRWHLQLLTGTERAASAGKFRRMGSKYRLRSRCRRYRDRVERPVLHPVYDLVQITEHAVELCLTIRIKRPFMTENRLISNIALHSAIAFAGCSAVKVGDDEFEDAVKYALARQTPDGKRLTKRQAMYPLVNLLVDRAQKGSL